MARVSTIQLYKGEGNVHSRDVLNAVRSQLAIVKNNDHPLAAQLGARAEANRIALTFISKSGPADINTVHRLSNLLLEASA
jgi:hypothetical protein